MTALPLILIAGWGHTGEAMRPLQEALAGYPVQVTSTAELWQARAGAVPGVPGLSRYAQGLRDLLAIRRLTDGRVGVIGWSMGGIVALELARQYPGLIERLVMISGTARFCVGKDELPALTCGEWIRTSLVEGPGVRATVLRAMALGLRRAPDAVLAAYYAKVHAPQSVPSAVPQNPAMVPPDREELLQGLDYLQRIDVRNGLDKLNIPTLVVHGREDHIVPWQAGEWLTRALAGSHWRCHAALGHALPIQAPLLLAEDIRAFLGDAA